MTDALSTAVSGLNNAAQRIASSANVIANASLTPDAAAPLPSSGTGTGGDTVITSPDAAAIVGSGDAPDLTSALVSILADSAIYGANAKVVSAVKKNEDALINVLA